LRIAPEGWPFIVPGWAIVAVGVWRAAAGGGPVMWGGAALLALLGVWLLVFFRDPRRRGPRGDRLIVAPADGKIVGVTVVQEPVYLKGEATRISIFMNVFDVHVNRYPVSGAIELVERHPGRFLHAAAEKASLDNEQTSVGIRGACGPILVRQIAGLIARRIVTDGRPGERATQGERMGMIRFGSRVDVFVPRAARPACRVTPGERVRAGSSVLAECET